MAAPKRVRYLLLGVCLGLALAATARTAPVRPARITQVRLPGEGPPALGPRDAPIRVLLFVSRSGLQGLARVLDRDFWPEGVRNEVRVEVRHLPMAAGPMADVLKGLAQYRAGGLAAYLRFWRSRRHWWRRRRPSPLRRYPGRRPRPLGLAGPGLLGVIRKPGPRQSCRSSDLRAIAANTILAYELGLDPFDGDAEYALVGSRIVDQWAHRLAGQTRLRQAVAAEMARVLVLRKTGLSNAEIAKTLFRRALAPSWTRRRPLPAWSQRMAALLLHEPVRRLPAPPPSPVHLWRFRPGARHVQFVLSNPTSFSSRTFLRRLSTVPLCIRDAVDVELLFSWTGSRDGSVERILLAAGLDGSAPKLIELTARSGSNFAIASSRASLLKAAGLHAARLESLARSDRVRRILAAHRKWSLAAGLPGPALVLDGVALPASKVPPWAALVVWAGRPGGLLDRHLTTDRLPLE